MTRLFLLIGLALCLISPLAHADPPSLLDYQGKFLVDDLPLEGVGYFKFALSDDTTYAELLPSNTLLCRVGWQAVRA